MLLVIDRDPHCNAHSERGNSHKTTLEQHQRGLYSRINSPEAWLSVRQRTSEAKAHINNGVRNAQILAANNRPTRTRAWSHRRRLARQLLLFLMDI